VSERPENRSGARRRSGPLGEDAEQTETRRDTMRSGSDDATQQISTDDATQRIQTDDATRQIPRQDPPAPRGGTGGRDHSSDTQEFQAAPKPTRSDNREDRGRARPASPAGRGGRGAASGSGGYGEYSTGYNEVLRDREEYLRDIYGGVDWLASFVGFIFTALFASLLGIGAALFLLLPLGLRQSLSDGQLDSTAITGIAVIASVGFLSFLLGGYISGRMARYDGARNGAMVLLWAILIVALLLVLSGVFGQAISETPAGDFVREALDFGFATVELMNGLGVSGAVVSGGVALAALLGGMFGGQLGSRYHREIDYTP